MGLRDRFRRKRHFSSEMALQFRSPATENGYRQIRHWRERTRRVNLRKEEKLLFVPPSLVISADFEHKGVIQRQQSLPTVEKRPKLSEQLTVQNQKRLASDQQSPQLEEVQELSSSKPPDTKVE
ncbi:hypothetical protein N665_1599s0002 [Sinapis alba]|nr:hypothetical protein N665_1599s0002 [Sinapis alba]